MIGDFRRLKFADSTGANGDESERAPSGHDFTHAQHFIHLELSIVAQSFAMASVGQTDRQIPHGLQIAVFTSGTSLRGDYL